MGIGNTSVENILKIRFCSAVQLVTSRSWSEKSFKFEKLTGFYVRLYNSESNAEVEQFYTIV